MTSKIGILGGTVPEGSGPAYRWACAGEHVVIGSREPQRADAAAKLLECGHPVSPQQFPEYCPVPPPAT
jgi:predicted dinucleotide-binding enzyme